MPSGNYAVAEFECEAECFEKGTQKIPCMRRCMNTKGWNLRGNYSGGKRKTKSMKKQTNKRRNNKRTFRKRVK